MIAASLILRPQKRSWLCFKVKAEVKAKVKVKVKAKVKVYTSGHPLCRNKATQGMDRLSLFYRLPTHI